MVCEYLLEFCCLVFLLYVQAYQSNCNGCMYHHNLEYTPSIDKPLKTVSPMNLEITVSTTATSEVVIHC